MTPSELRSVWTLLPYSAQQIMDCLGDEAAAKLLAARPGCQFLVPRHADRHPSGAKRWAELAAIVGDEAMEALAARWGGDVIEIPTCKTARDELRARAIRAEFDRLTVESGYSGKQAVYEIGLKFAPISSRAIELMCGRADAGEQRQESLF